MELNRRLDNLPRRQVGYHQIPNMFNPNSTAKKRSGSHDENNDDDDEVEDYRSGQPAGLVGIKNLGNTCFINSALQCLMNVQPLMDYFLSDLHEEETNVDNPLGSKGIITKQFADLVRKVWCEKDKYITPTAFKNVVQSFSSIFGDGSQQDSQEFIIFLLDYLHEDLNRVKEKPYIKDKDYESKESKDWEGNSLEAWRDYLQRNKSVVVDLFQGQLKSTLKCLDCGAVSHKFETFMYLSVPISEEMQQASHSLITIEDCIEEFTREETLDETEWWLCTHCKKRTPSTKKIDLWKTPNILIVHFKRFAYSKKNRGKINSFIDFKLTQFDLSSQVAGKEKVKPIYDLFAVCNHTGSLKGGHYTAYAKNRDSEEWHYFDDTNVSKVANPLKSILSSKAYVLFYSKTSPEKFQRQTLTFPEFWPHLIRSNTSDSTRKQLIEGDALRKLQHQNSSNSNNNNNMASNTLAVARSTNIMRLEEQRRTFTTLGIQKEDTILQSNQLQTPVQSSFHRGISAHNRAGITKQDSSNDKQPNANIFSIPNKNLTPAANNGYPMWDDEKADSLAKFSGSQQSSASGAQWRMKGISSANAANNNGGSIPFSTLVQSQQQQRPANWNDSSAQFEYQIGQGKGGASANHPLANSFKKRASKEYIKPIAGAAGGTPATDPIESSKRQLAGNTNATATNSATTTLEAKNSINATGNSAGYTFNNNASQILLSNNRKITVAGTLPKIDSKSNGVGKFSSKSKEIDEWLVSQNLLTRTANVAGGSDEPANFNSTGGNTGAIDGRLAMIKQRINGAQSATSNYHSSPGGVVVVKQSSHHFTNSNASNDQFMQNTQQFHSTGAAAGYNLSNNNSYSKTKGNGSLPIGQTLGASVRVDRKMNQEEQFPSIFTEEAEKDSRNNNNNNNEIVKGNVQNYNQRSASQNKQYSIGEANSSAPQTSLAKRGFAFEKPGMMIQKQNTIRENSEHHSMQASAALKSSSSSNFITLNGQQQQQQQAFPSQSHVFMKESKQQQQQQSTAAANFSSSASTAATFDQSPNRQRKVKNSITNGMITKPQLNPHMMFSVSKSKRPPVGDDFDDF